ncbi:SWR1 complex subunit vps71 [Wickerhamiella sorbophila]|uniref:SWR1 complex subunit vps71 n=1 Tax=Wickerhamiella sorbophila TaxID=45607 RepID=A0A2T0FEY8_9ASCO|nr:SWR1 complex subunit vps71 [Wickerhamiella sorbophila]PRT53562.1 SWR1 complex subunit vps71 [Wickerhamiella sorbophila]
MKIDASADLTGAPLHRAGAKTAVIGARTVDAAKVSQQRARKRRINELMNENFRDVKIEIPPAYLKGGPKAGKTVNSRRILASRRTLANHLDDDQSATQKFLSMAARPSPYPSRPKCSICGYFSNAVCIRCGARYCSLACMNVHTETRCQR